ncbi:MULTISPECIES: hypothetical protein [Halomonadaceae]|uniref:hypothetical protein n=1 Tax=Halomonadaceae TaxID=28256 RepID=UPI00159ACF1F|nr:MULTISPECIES: hypothetical protein [Halomonas]QJQ95438.1 hypothetical protein HIO72_09230 [Halomonas sp. PA5]
MVSKAVAPELAPAEVFEVAFRERVHFKDFYNRIREDWWRNISIYIAHEGDPAVVHPLALCMYTDDQQQAKDRKKSLINLYYPQKGSWLHSNLYKMRRNHDLIFCPSCGESGTPTTLDHYLPKTEFPEFSVLLHNLTPMCTICQEEKGTEWVTDEGGKKFLHPYYDDILFPLIKIDFYEPFKTPSFNIRIHDGVPADLHDLASNHIEGVGINRRLKEFSRKKYIQLLKNAMMHRNGNRKMLFREKVDMFLEHEEYVSINRWEAVFYRSVLEDQKLLHYLENGELPRHL